jgi:hypothetical protein
MKSSSILFIALVSTLAIGASAFAQGPGNARQGVAAQARAATTGQAGLGSATGTATQAQLHTPGTGLTDPTLAIGRPSGAGTPRGIHTPGTGLVTPVAN